MSIPCTLTLRTVWDADFRCFWVTFSCLATSVFVIKSKNIKRFLKNYSFSSPGWRLPCVNGDWLCQWVRAIFVPPQNRHPLIDHQKIVTGDYVNWRPPRLCQIRCISVLGRLLGTCEILKKIVFWLTVLTGPLKWWAKKTQQKRLSLLLHANWCP